MYYRSCATIQNNIFILSLRDEWQWGVAISLFALDCFVPRNDQSNHMQPEILVEQIMGYVVGANDMIPDIAKKIDRAYHLALLPYGPHFYTGILQSAGYLLLNEQKSTLFLMPQQAKKDEIYQLTWTIWPILGRSRTFQTDKKTRNTEFEPGINDLWILLQHLAFSHTITQTDQISCLAVGDKLSPIKLKKLTTYLTKRLPTTNIVFLSNFTTDTKQQKPDLLMLADQTGLGVLQWFQSVTSILDKEPEIIAYTSTGSPKEKKTTGYACILA